MAAAASPCRLSAIAQALDLPKSATHRLLREMLALGWAQQDGSDGPYRLSLRFALLGRQVLRASGLEHLVQPVLDGLAGDTRELVRLTVGTERGLTWFAAAQGAPPGLLYQPSMHGPVVLHATANGKAYLARLDDPMVLARQAGLGTVRPTARTITSEPALAAELARVRERGFAVAAEEAEHGITAVAVAVVAHGATVPLGTVSIAGPSLRIGADRVPELSHALHRVATMLAGVWPIETAGRAAGEGMR